MTGVELHDRFADVAFTTAVPFTDDGDRVRHDALGENLAALYDAGARLFVPCGNTGEYYALTDDERAAIVETHVDATGEDATVVGGVAGNLPRVDRLASAYADAGADAIMVMHPDHTYVHEAGLAEYYHRICDRTDLGVVIYKRGEEVTRSVLSELSQRETVVAVKFAVGDVVEFAQTVADAEGDVAWINGLAERYAISFAIEGAIGYTTGIGNFLPEPTLALHEAIEEGNWNRARSIQDALRPFEDLREGTGEGNSLAAANNVPAVKYGMDLAGYAGGPVRPPLVDLSTEDRRRLDRYYEDLETAPLVSR